MNDISSSTVEACVRCNSCVALCPTYKENPVEGMNARGRIALLKKLRSGEISPSKRLEQRINSCMLCGACTMLCPMGINIADKIYEGKSSLREIDKKKLVLGYGVKLALRQQNSVVSLLRHLSSVAALSPFSAIPPFKTLREMNITIPHTTLRSGESIFRTGRAKGRIAVIAGCTVNYLYPHMGQSLIKSLNAAHYEVVLPKSEVCCGAPLLGFGLQDDAARLAEKNLLTFKNLKTDAVISLCPTCVSFIKEEYKRLLGEGIDHAMDISEFFARHVPLPTPSQVKKPQSRSETKSVIYHAPCHLLYCLNIKNEPQQILNSLELPLIQPRESGCCGFAGTFRFFYPELSGQILEQRIEDYAQADMIVTSCPNCVLQFKTKIRNKPVKHIIEIISEHTNAGNSL
jgi:glycolate oxidase iron-sulfur subunit